MEKEKQLLIISDHFPPTFAPRMGYLAKYIRRFGWDCTVVATLYHRDLNTFDMLATGVTAYDIPNYAPTGKPAIDKIANEFMGMLRGGFMWSVKDQRAYNKAKQLAEKQHFDAVLCSTSGFYPLNAAYRIARKLKLPFIVDLRDLYEQNTTFYRDTGLAGLLHSWQKRVRNRIVGKADCVITVSDWHVDLLKQFNPNTLCIFNGFDPEMFFPIVEKVTTKFTITYTGTITTPTGDFDMRNPSILFDAMRRLSDAGRIDSNFFVVKFYLDSLSRERVGEMAKSFGIDNFVEFYDWVPADEVPRILAESNVLLVLTENKSAHGIMTTKLYEYMAVGREILCVPVESGQLFDIMSQADAGYCTDNIDMLMRYINRKYAEWRKTGKIHCTTDMYFVNRFSRLKQAGQFVQCFDEAVAKHGKK